MVADPLGGLRKPFAHLRLPEPVGMITGARAVRHVWLRLQQRNRRPHDALRRRCRASGLGVVGTQTR